MLLASTGSPQGPFGFAAASGYQEDGDGGLKLLGHRYYDPSTGRFLTRDPIGSGRNWYRYCDNNPLSNLDPEGLQGESKATKDGRAWHKVIQDHYKRQHPGTKTETKLPGTRMRPDINDVTNQIVIEIKPDNTKAIKLGVVQAMAYAEELGYDDVWIYTYPPGTNLSQSKDPMSHVHWVGGHYGILGMGW